MATLNITYNGLSSDLPLELDGHVSDVDVRRIAVEVVRSGGVPGLHIANLREDAFDPLRGGPLPRPPGRRAHLPAAQGALRGVRRARHAHHLLWCRGHRLHGGGAVPQPGGHARLHRLRPGGVQEPARAGLREALGGEEQGRGAEAPAPQPARGEGGGLRRAGDARQRGGAVRERGPARRLLRQPGEPRAAERVRARRRASRWCTGRWRRMAPSGWCAGTSGSSRTPRTPRARPPAREVPTCPSSASLAPRSRGWCRTS